MLLPMLTAKESNVGTASQQWSTVHNRNTAGSPTEDKQIEPIRTIITINPISESEMNAMNDLAYKEAKYSKLMCLSVKLQGVDMGYALVDQGASRSLMRRSLLTPISHIITEVPVDNYVVISSSGTEIPIVSKFR